MTSFAIDKLTTLLITYEENQISLPVGNFFFSIKAKLKFKFYRCTNNE